MKRAKSQAGFSTLEMLVVVAMSVVITAIAVPSFLSTSQFFRIAGDLRAINGLTAQAKMRAAADFTHARVYADLTHGTYQLQVWYKTGGASRTGWWGSDSGPGLLNNQKHPTSINWASSPPPTRVRH